MLFPFQSDSLTYPYGNTLKLRVQYSVHFFLDYEGFIGVHCQQRITASISVQRTSYKSRLRSTGGMPALWFGDSMFQST